MRKREDLFKKCRQKQEQSSYRLPRGYQQRVSRFALSSAVIQFGRRTGVCPQKSPLCPPVAAVRPNTQSSGPALLVLSLRFSTVTD